MRLSLKVKVTQKDIDTGERRSFNKCPVSKALRRALKNYHGSFPNCCFYGDTWSYFDQKIIQWISDFDRYGNILQKPFSFTINVRPEYVKTKNESNRRSKTSAKSR